MRAAAMSSAVSSAPRAAVQCRGPASSRPNQTAGTSGPITTARAARRAISPAGSVPATASATARDTPIRRSPTTRRVVSVHTTSVPATAPSSPCTGE